MLHGKAKFEDFGLVEMHPGFMEGQGRILPFSRPVGMLRAWEKGVVVVCGENGKGLEEGGGIEEEGSGVVIRTTEIAIGIISLLFAQIEFAEAFLCLVGSPLLEFRVQLMGGLVEEDGLRREFAGVG